MERVYGGRVAEHAAEIAHQYDRSKDLPGAARGAEHAITAAERAEAGTAWEEAAAFLRMALTLMEPDDARRPRVSARLGRSLALIPEPETALATVQKAVELLELSEGADAASDYISEMMELLFDAGFRHQAVALAELGLARLSAARDMRWARFAALVEIGSGAQRFSTRQPGALGDR